jgi:cation transport ATPase
MHAPLAESLNKRALSRGAVMEQIKITADERLRTRTRLFLKIVTILCVLLAFTVPFELFVAGMLSDAGPMPFLTLTIFWAFGFPVVLIVTPAAGWRAYKAGSYRAAWRWSLTVPLIWIAGMAILMLVTSRYGFVWG